MDFELQTCAPSDLGLDPHAMDRLLDQFISGELYANAMILLRHGKICTEFYRTPYRPNQTHALASVTKSIVSIAAGFAVGDGLIDVEDSVTGFFPDLVAQPVSPNMSAMKLKHLLTMTSGFCGEIQDPAGGDAIRRFLLTPPPLKPGKKFAYNTDGVALLSQIIERATGIHFEQYVREKLFKPLGIETYIWEKENSSMVNAGYGLHLKARDLAKIGQFLLNNGVWNGKQLLAPDWIRRATSPQSRGGDYGYGYLLWMEQVKRSYAACGLAGQYCVVLPEQDMVVVLLDAKNQKREVLKAIYKTIRKGLDRRMKHIDFDASLLVQKCGRIVVPFPEGEKHHASEAVINGKKYALEANSLGLTHIGFDFDDYSLLLYENEKRCRCRIGYGEWLESDTYADPLNACTKHFCGLHTPVSIAGAWEGGRYHLKQVYTEMPMIDDMMVSFSEDGAGIRIQYERSDKTFFDPDTTICGSCLSDRSE